MKKALIITLSLTLVLGTVFAASAKKAGVLEIWTDKVRYEILKPITEDFEDDYSVDVELSQINYDDIRSQFNKAAPSQEGPDILIGAHDWTGELAQNGLLEPIIMSEDLKEKFTEVSLDAFTYNDNIYGLPYSMEAIALIYNKELVEEPPETWDELMEAARELTNPEEKKYGFVYPGTGDPYHTYPFISAHGGYIFKYEGGFNPDQLGLTTEGALKGLRILDKMYEDGLIPQGIDYSTSQGLFTEGDAGMWMTGPWAISGVKEAGIDFGVMKLPPMDGNQPKPFVGVNGFYLSSYAEDMVLANEFLTNYVATEDVMTELYEEGNRPPVYKPVREKAKDDPTTAAFLESASVGTPMPNIPEMNATWGALTDKLQLISQQKQEPEAAMEAAEEIIKEAIGQGEY
ncbi:maltose/maltodextrin ABC transporter substrate-binding protein MalE [Candidatus Bipolaricaulota bacterium]|nr:maltose/maltodextrin ABC transporter substrate-binding protein MalE [Candidatus Bipolaricaulota bacterium]